MVDLGNNCSGYKLVILGETDVGKSSIMHRFAKNIYTDHHEVTIGAAFMVKTVEVSGRSVKFEIWDTAGQERYRSLAPVYYRGAEAAVVVYDITNYDSYEKAKLWVMELYKKSQDLVVAALVGNKIDIPDKRKVNIQEAKSFATENELLFFETSAKNNINISDVFRDIAESLPARKPAMNRESVIDIGTPQITPSKSNETKRCCW